jgi:hypothetical protein
MNGEERVELMRLGLNEKITDSIKTITEALDRFGKDMVLAWTRGKDTITML